MSQDEKFVDLVVALHRAGCSLTTEGRELIQEYAHNIADYQHDCNHCCAKILCQPVQKEIDS